MTATNHALTGAIIGLTIGNPLVAVPVALLSHFVLDALPHFKPNIPERELIKTKSYTRYLMAEALLCALIVLVLFAVRPHQWFLAAICAFAAAAPDLASYPRYKRVRADKPLAPNAYHKFASKIQWFERPIGGVVEIVWFVCAVTLLAKLI